MTFKFTFFGIESSNCKDKKSSKNKSKTTMKKKKRISKKKKLTPHQKKFSMASSKCHSKTKNPKSFGNCMSLELKK